MVGVFFFYKTIGVSQAKRHPTPISADLVNCVEILYARLAMRAKQEGISMNSLVISFLAEGLGKREIG